MTQSRQSAVWRATTSAQNLRTPLRAFLRTETGGAAVLLAATVAALAWANIGASSYASAWSTQAAVSVGHAAVSLDLRGWVNSGLMMLFFLVVGFDSPRPPGPRTCRPRW